MEPLIQVATIESGLLLAVMAGGFAGHRYKVEEVPKSAENVYEEDHEKGGKAYGEDERVPEIATGAALRRHHACAGVHDCHACRRTRLCAQKDPNGSCGKLRRLGRCGLYTECPAPAQSRGAPGKTGTKSGVDTWLLAMARQQVRLGGWLLGQETTRQRLGCRTLGQAGTRLGLGTGALEVADGQHAYSIAKEGGAGHPLCGS
jgi:hypothetical protein